MNAKNTQKTPRRSAKEATQGSDTPRLTVKGVMVILNDRGLHTRPATELVCCAQQFQSEIVLVYRDTEASAKSILEILMLSATRGARISVEATGPDAAQAVAALIALASSRFNINY